MNFTNFSAALITLSLLVAAPAFAQNTPAQKQPTQEGGGGYAPCGLPFNATPTAQPGCRQQTQSLVPSATQGAAEANNSHK
ncbi:MAG TPA: hypothetical protein VHX39_17745 [Acetobacteraceae bacterium]|nr:hypothetical protein [Acetobacteraceae bacterium]